MTNKKTSSLNVPAIEKRREEIRKRKEELKNEFLNEVLDPQPIITSLLSSWATRKLIPGSSKSKLYAKDSFFYKKIVAKDPTGILSIAFQIAQNPVVAGFLSKTGKSWLYWQLFNLSLKLLKKTCNKKSNK